MAGSCSAYVLALALLGRLVKGDHLLSDHSRTACFVVCTARCLLQHSPNATLSNCATDCRRHFSKQCSTTGRGCWKDAVDSVCPRGESETDRVPRHEPFDLTASYATNPHAQPYAVELRWTPVQYASLYVVEAKDMDDLFVKFGDAAPADLLLFQSTSGQFTKPRLCPTYGFRVAAANHLGVSNFSEVAAVTAPTPELGNATYRTSDVRMLDVPFESSNRTLSLTFQYSLPANWNPDDLANMQSTLHWIDCATMSKSGIVDDKTIVTLNESKVVVLTHEVDLSKSCRMMFRIDSMESICGTRCYFPPTVGAVPGLMVHLSCDTVLNSNCGLAKAPAPLCTTDQFVYDVQLAENDTSSVNLNITWRMRATPTPILYYAINVVELENATSNFNLFHVPKMVRQVLLVRTCQRDEQGRLYDFQNSTNNALLGGLPVGSKYGVLVCAVFNETSEEEIAWNITARQEIDLTRVLRNPTLRRHRETNVVVVVASCVMALFTLFAALSLVYRFAKLHVEKKRKNINELVRDGFTVGSFENAYVVQPKRFDHWEISRSQVEIDYSKKLGAGAFGAVYKCKLSGRLVSSKLSNSPVAENWTKTEDCVAAVKMLPEYADDSSKSDFRKEINLMKRLGYHEKLVSMLGCITVDEPLCLIVEYCSDGDLLHYLRDRRLYMIKLEEAGVDLKNVADNKNVDLDLVLCFKDLISFSWQICVGLEFLSQKGYVHRDVAARNVLVDHDKRIKIGDFGLCRFICTDMAYMGKGGRLPVKWMAPEAIKTYEFTTKSDVWSFGILLFEIITLGGSPYPGVQPSEVEQLLEEGKRMEQPINCPDEMYKIMLNCWLMEANRRPDFTEIRESLRVMLEEITEDYDYTGLSQHRDYYNVATSDDKETSSTDGEVNNAFEQISQD